VQTQLKFSGQLACCDCGKQPKAYSERHGKSFFLECSPCAKCTGKFPSLGEAVQAWEQSATTHIQRAMV
jgi:hypothetical protein